MHELYGAGFTAKQLAAAFLEGWDKSYAGWAIVDKDFKFVCVNDQFCDLCGVSAAELLGKSFADITTDEMRDIDIENAHLVMEGKRPSGYTLQKTYRFIQKGNLRLVPVELLVKGVFVGDEFQFFFSRIALRDKPRTFAGFGFQEGLTWIENAQRTWKALTFVVAFTTMVVYLVIRKLARPEDLESLQRVFSP